MEYKRVHIRKVVGPTGNGTAVILSDGEKNFVIFIGEFEGSALVKEMNHEVSPRPLTHDLISTIFLGFDIRVKRVVITDLVKTTYYASLILEQRCADEKGEWNGKRNEVRIDARPSDCLVIAIKEKAEIWVAESVLQKVRDVSQEIQWSKETGDDL